MEPQGRLEEAQAFLERCLRIGRAQLGDEHPRVLVYTVNLARVRIARGPVLPGVGSPGPHRRRPLTRRSPRVVMRFSSSSRPA
jgi:hypothetical protein